MRLFIFILVVFALTSKPSVAIAADYDAIKGKRPGLGVQVVQNRFFTKKLRPEVGFFAGTFLNEAFTNTRSTGVRLNLFLSEWLGLEAIRLNTLVQDSNDYKALQEIEFRDKEDPDKLVKAEPEINPINGSTDLGIVVVPFYGKLNFFDQLILYSDLFFSVAYSKLETKQGPINGFSVAGGQKFFFGKSAAIQLELRNRFYTEKRNDASTNRNALSIDIGGSYFFF